LNETNTTKSSLSYRQAGVDIDAGNELVERIKPAVKNTMRPEVLTGLGGFGALFELEAAGTEARTEKFMTELRDAIQTALNDCFANGKVKRPVGFLERSISQFIFGY
jgi:phosphoribosylaminoimidazole (AIR) synthetase